MAKREIDIPTFGCSALTEETINSLNMSYHYEEDDDELASRLNKMVVRRWENKLRHHVGLLGIYMFYWCLFLVFTVGAYTIGKAIFLDLIKL